MDTSPSDIEPTLSVLYRLSVLSGFTVIDEIHNYRVPTNSTSQGLLFFMKACKGRKLGMTATPFYNTLENAFQEYSLLSPAILGTYDSFRLHYLVTEERETQAYRWINTPLGKRKVLVPTTFTEVKGYKNIDAFMEVLRPYLYLDQGTEFSVSSMLARYEVQSPSAYAEVIQGLDLSSCIALTIAGEGSTNRRIFKTGETLRVTVPGMDLGWSLREVSDITAGLDVLLETREGPALTPQRLNAFFEKLANNHLSVRVNMLDEKYLMTGFQKIANRLTTGLILAALIIGAAAMMNVPTHFTLLGYPGLAIMFFIMAGVGGLFLIFNILFQDEATRRK